MHFSCAQNFAKTNLIKGNAASNEVRNQKDSASLEQDSTNVLMLVEEHSEVADTIKTFFKNGKLKQLSLQGYVNSCGIQVGDELNFDKLGNVVLKRSFKHFLPKEVFGCHNIWIIISDTFYHTNGIISELRKTKTCYECEEYPCGKWIYYNSNGEVLKSENYESCDDMNFDSE